jgi:DNA mismatch repair protein MutS2
MSINLNQLEGISKRKARDLDRKSSSNYNKLMTELHDKAANFQLKLDLRGERAEDAINRLQKFIDEAILLRIYDVEILHGKGTGVLRQVIRDYLSGIPEVKKFGDNHVERGGAGMTIVSLDY